MFFVYLIFFYAGQGTDRGAEQDRLDPLPSGGSLEELLHHNLPRGAHRLLHLLPGLQYGRGEGEQKGTQDQVELHRDQADCAVFFKLGIFLACFIMI